MYSFCSSNENGSVREVEVTNFASAFPENIPELLRISAVMVLSLCRLTTLMKTVWVVFEYVEVTSRKGMPLYFSVLNVSHSTYVSIELPMQLVENDLKR